MQQQLSLPGKIVALALATVVLVAAAAPAFAHEAPLGNPFETDDRALTIAAGAAYIPC
ncbi:hypothetical protein [Sphingomonas sanxanigenens]|uniref:Uncharacterized protein n=1 Tax=Sphingomonas sanxanigenens DSM 19645 = NX02 TaxID=1123269 RepID=W0A4K0_9SPHN|nr:hypothetical protein [Sphingomonas sanxanigenens]AHE51956.1 hypothetical protein NX02_00950 [Sphingomonas sanxanigenens DSM 19645 = NX02]